MVETVETSTTSNLRLWREVVKELLEQELNVPVLERDVERTELYVADEAFICGSAVEVQAIGSVDRYQVGDGGAGPIVTQLIERLSGVVLGLNPEYARWLTPVYQAR